MRFRLLGPVTADVELGPAKQRAVLVLLALRANQSVARGEIIDGVWGEDVPPSAPNLVATYVARLRRLIDVAAAAIGAGSVATSTIDHTSAHVFRIAPGWRARMEDGWNPRRYFRQNRWWVTPLELGTTSRWNR